MGAEEVHGENTYHKYLAEKSGGLLVTRKTENDYITYKCKF